MHNIEEENQKHNLSVYYIILDISTLQWEFSSTLVENVVWVELLLQREHPVVINTKDLLGQRCGNTCQKLVNSHMDARLEIKT